MSILDPKFRYVDSTNTNIRDTLKRFGFRATTEAERKERQRRKDEPSNVLPITRRKAK